ncbi:MAG: methyltransferase [Bacteroidota bacterium]
MEDKSLTPGPLEQFKAILALPFVVLIVVPTSIIWDSYRLPIDPIGTLPSTVAIALGVLFLLLGLPLFVQAIRLFILIGKGTLAPWKPTRKLVVKSLYRHMRNPMITGVILILLAESLLLKSSGILLWGLFFFLLNHLYFRLKEEPDLLKRFGDEYQEYKTNVPRWIPRFPGWHPESSQSS